MGKPHREICALCYEVSRVGFYVPNEIWRAAIHKHYQNSIICLRCFTRLADEKSVQWDKEIKFYPVSWITHSTSEVRNDLKALADTAEASNVPAWFVERIREIIKNNGTESDAAENPDLQTRPVKTGGV